MMELDELKKELNLKLAGSSEQRSSKDIASLLRNDAVSIVQKLKRSLLAELVISVLYLALCCYMIIAGESWIYRVFFGSFAVIGITFIAVLGILLNKTNRLTVAANVKHNLEKLIAVLDEYVRRYLQLTLILLPLTFVFGVWMSYNDEQRVLKPLAGDTIIYLSLAMIVLAAGVYFFTKWYLKKLYGNYLAQLKSFLKELNEEG